jgi:two-component sensor histidine kinase
VQAPPSENTRLFSSQGLARTFASGALTLVVSVLVFTATREELRRAIQSEFETEARVRTVRVRRSIEEKLALLEVVRSLYGNVGDRTADLRGLIEPTLRQREGTQSFAWVTRVRNEDRAEFEAYQRTRERLSQFEITERSRDGELVRSNERHEYFPIVPINPAELRADLAGFDLLSDSVRGAVIRESRDSGELVSTARVPLIGDSGPSPYGFLVSAPVFRGGDIPATVEARRRLLEGVVLGVFRLSDGMVEEVGLGEEPGMSLVLLGRTADGTEEVLLGSNPFKGGTLDSRDVESLGSRFVPEPFVADFVVARRPWKLIISSKGDPTGEMHLQATWFLLFGVLGLGGGVTGFLEVSRRSAIRRRDFALARERSLAEKDTLIEEIHHRVKNNLQVVASLHTLQLDRVSDPDIRAIFEVARDRIDSIAMVHEQLYGSRDLARIRVGSYVGKLARQLSHIHKGPSGIVRVDVEAEEIELPLRLAAPFGLLLNELVTNALRHGFPDGRGGRVLISIKIRREGEIELVVSDDGVGFSQGGDQPEGGLGLQLVGALNEQLGGHLEFVGNGGTTAVLRFSVEA